MLRKIVSSLSTRKKLKLLEPYFDDGYYQLQSERAYRNKSHALRDYLSKGFRENKNPNWWLNNRFYLEVHPDVADSGISPLEHFVRFGFSEKRKTYPGNAMDLSNFDSLEQLKVKKENDVKRVSKSKEEYRAEAELIKKSDLFDLNWFGLKYPDLKGRDMILYYCICGYREGRFPNPFFDSNWYSAKYLGEEGKNPLVHYIEVGKNRNYSTAPNFNSKKYFEMYPEVGGSGLDSLTHFLTYGRNKGFRAFDCGEKSQYPIKSGSSIASTIANDINGLYKYTEHSLAPDSETFNRDSLNIHFVIPDFGVGGGGHMNIFRMVKFLELFGHDITIWIFNPKNHKSGAEAYEDIVRHYYTVKSKVSLLDANFLKARGDIIFATSWNTVWPVQSVTNFKRRFYFVQDFEPLFYPKGARSELANYTYGKDLDCICASKWLNNIMTDRFGRWSRYFNLAADQSIFYPSVSPENECPKIVLYARHFTERRAVELALIALEMLAVEGVEFHVDMYGATFPVNEVPYSCNIYDKQTPSQLAELYRAADVGIVFSLTNYSLVPQEMMACGLPIIEFNTESTRAIYPEGGVLLAGPDPKDIKEKIKTLLKDTSLQNAQSKIALDWVRQFSWEGAARHVESSLIDRLLELGFKDVNSVEPKAQPRPKASIVIPTCNAGEMLRLVLDSVFAQKAPWPFEVIVLDSQSTDGTVELIQSYDQIVYREIERSSFNHGGTRNFGVKIAAGEFVAFLTQDAIPATDYWLYDLVSMLEKFPKAAGVFGKHVAHDNASLYTRQELDSHFSQFLELPLVVSKATPVPDNIGEGEWNRILHFYSDNNSCLRKSAWVEVPYPEVQYGEDQLWADKVVNAGYSKIYCPSAVVKHSHDYQPEDVYERAVIEGDFFKYHWGYELVSERSIEQIIRDSSDADTLLGLKNGLSDSEIELRRASIRARYIGYLAGQKKPVSLFSPESSEKSKF